MFCFGYLHMDIYSVVYYQTVHDDNRDISFYLACISCMEIGTFRFIQYPYYY